jgi:hypothetical protein
MKINNLIIYIFFLIGCKISISEENRVKGEVIDFINVKKLDSLISPRELMKDVEFINLKTPESFKLTFASKIQKINEKFLVLDAKKKLLFAFDNTGNFIGQVGKKGEGPQEYKEVTDFNINPNSMEINIFSRADHAILQFDSNLSFKKRIKLNNWASQFGILDSGNFAFYSFLGEEEGSSFNINIYNSAGKKLDQRMKIPPIENEIAMNYSGFINNEFYSYPLSSKIFKIQENKGNDSLVYIINFPNKFEEEDIFDFGSYLNPKNNIKKNILSKFEIGNNGEFLCYYEFKEGSSNGYTLGIRLANGETFGHLNMKHASENKADIYVRMFFIGPYNIPSYSPLENCYYIASNIDAISVYYKEIKETINKKEISEGHFLELLESTDLEETILMKFKLKESL